jgi:hypothetical protein
VSQDLPVLWSPAQQAWLQAMGYTVYHDGQLAAELDAALQLSVAEAEASVAPPEPVRAPVPRANSMPGWRPQPPGTPGTAAPRNAGQRTGYRAGG